MHDGGEGEQVGMVVKVIFPDQVRECGNKRGQYKEKEQMPDLCHLSVLGIGVKRVHFFVEISNQPKPKEQGEKHLDPKHKFKEANPQLLEPYQRGIPDPLLPVVEKYFMDELLDLGRTH
jgi:hypothetical protein